MAQKQIMGIIKLKRLENNNAPELTLNKLQLEMIDLINQKIESGEYQFEDTECPICHHKNRDLIGEKDRYGLYFPTNICLTCGIWYTSPRMTQLSYNKFYNNEQKKLYVGIEEPTESYFLRQKRKGKKIYDFLQKNNILNPDSSYVLEVGCAAGGIIDFFREKGAKVKGIDLGEQYIDYGRNLHGLDLEVGTLKSLSNSKKPDLIIYSHVLEHILDVNAEIELIKHFSSDNTIIYIEVPGIKEIHKNYDMNILKYLQNSHTFHFTLESLINLMSTHGFELIKGNQYVRSTFKLTNRVLPLQNDHDQVVKYIKRIEKGRLIPLPNRAYRTVFEKLFLKF